MSPNTTIPEFVVVVRAFGDGEMNYGHRFSTHRFRTRAGAEKAAAFFDRTQDVWAEIVED